MEVAQTIVLIVAGIMFLAVARYIIKAEDYEKTEGDTKVKKAYSKKMKVFHILGAALLVFILARYAFAAVAGVFM